MLIGRKEDFDAYCYEAIDRYDYDFYLIRQIKNIKCTCVDVTTKNPDLRCPLCLGLGTRIKIFCVRGASAEAPDANIVRTSTGATTPKVFYIKQKLHIHRDDYIVDAESIYKTFKCQWLRGRNGEYQVTKVVASNLIGDKMFVYKNFKRLLKENSGKDK